MFEENLYVHDGVKQHYLGTSLALSEPLPMVFRFWMTEMARDVLRLGVYFHAAAIFLQVPGAADYHAVLDDEYEEKNGLCFDTLIDDSRKEILLAALANCLDRLGVKTLMTQVTDERQFAESLPREWSALLERREQLENGLLSVVAGCLDALIVTPGMEEIDQDDEPHRWHGLRVERGPFKDRI